MITTTVIGAAIAGVNVLTAILFFLASKQAEHDGEYVPRTTIRILIIITLLSATWLLVLIKFVHTLLSTCTY